MSRNPDGKAKTSRKSAKSEAQNSEKTTQAAGKRVAKNGTTQKPAKAAAAKTSAVPGRSYWLELGVKF